MINLGIIVAGYMAKKYMEVLDNSYKFKVQCIAANTIKNSKKLLKKYKIKYFYNDYKEMLKRNKFRRIFNYKILFLGIINKIFPNNKFIIDFEKLDYINIKKFETEKSKLENYKTFTK